MINNLKEFFESRGVCDLHAGAMYEYGRALYKYTFGPWTSYLVEAEPARDIEYSLVMKKTAGGHVYLVPGGIVPEDIASFFLIDHDFGMNTFAEYVALIAKYHEEHDVKDWTYRMMEDTLTVTGTHHVPAKVIDVYYESDEAKKNTLDLAANCVGIKVGSIIEGANYDATPFELYFPFEGDLFSEELDNLDSEVDAEWKKNNSTYYSIKDEESGEKELWCQWVDCDDKPMGNFAEDDKESEALAIAAGNALYADDYPDEAAIPGYPGKVAVREEMPIDY